MVAQVTTIFLSFFFPFLPPPFWGAKERWGAMWQNIICINVACLPHAMSAFWPCATPSKFPCVYVCVCVVYMWVVVRGGHWMSFSTSPHSDFQDSHLFSGLLWRKQKVRRPSHLNTEPSEWQSWPTSEQHLPACLPRAGVTVICWHACFYVNSRDWKWGPHDCGVSNGPSGSSQARYD